MSDIMSPEERAAAKTRCDAATPGTWRVNQDERRWTNDDASMDGDWRSRRDADADFVMHARTDLPRALATIEVLEELLPRCRSCSNPASCIGTCEGDPVWEPSCDTCCGHGNDDGRCVYIKDIAAEITALRAKDATIDALEEDRDVWQRYALALCAYWNRAHAGDQIPQVIIDELNATEKAVNERCR